MTLTRFKLLDNQKSLGGNVAQIKKFLILLYSKSVLCLCLAFSNTIESNYCRGFRHKTDNNKNSFVRK